MQPTYRLQRDPERTGSQYFCPFVGKIRLDAGTQKYTTPSCSRPQVKY